MRSRVSVSASRASVSACRPERCAEAGGAAEDAANRMDSTAARPAARERRAERDETRTAPIPIRPALPGRVRLVPRAGRHGRLAHAARALRAACLLLPALATTGCQTANAVGNFFLGGPAPAPGEGGRLEGFIGGVAADEPRAALIGRDILATGGTAADAAVAMGFTLAATLPSRASLGAGGACLAYNPNRSGPGGGAPEAIMFTSPAPAAGMGGDRPAAVPMLARGMFALHARYGRRPFETMIAPAEQMARLGVPISRAFARDLATVGGALLADPGARAAFGPQGVPLAEGQQMLQPDLGATLAQIRTAGVGDMYQGALARRLADASARAGGPLSTAELRAALPRTATPVTVPAGRDRVAFLPPPADGGLAAAAAFQTLFADPNAAVAANARAMGVAARLRAGGSVDPAALLAAPPSGGSLGPLPASTSWVTLDRDGDAVACAVGMNNLFGTGRVAPGTGILLAASPAAMAAPLLAAAIVYNANIHAFRAEVAGSGQEGAPLAVAAGLVGALRSRTAMPAPVPEPGRANAIACAGYLPDAEGSCAWATDSRGNGLAAGSN